MAFRRVLAILAVIAITLPTIARASEHIVGIDAGWNLNVNYTAWAEGKDFRVGDTLGVFRYPVGNHNMFKVNGPDFQACNVPPANESMTTGMGVITLATPNRKWYICGKGDRAHCMKGQKLAIIVMPVEWLAPMQASSMMLIETFFCDGGHNK